MVVGQEEAEMVSSVVEILESAASVLAALEFLLRSLSPGETATAVAATAVCHTGRGAEYLLQAQSLSVGGQVGGRWPRNEWAETVPSTVVYWQGV